jgi:hypothetical protein
VDAGDRLDLGDQLLEPRQIVGERCDVEILMRRAGREHRLDRALEQLHLEQLARALGLALVAERAVVDAAHRDGGDRPALLLVELLGMVERLLLAEAAFDTADRVVQRAHRPQPRHLVHAGGLGAAHALGRAPVEAECFDIAPGDGGATRRQAQVEHALDRRR